MQKWAHPVSIEEATVSLGFPHTLEVGDTQPVQQDTALQGTVTQRACE